MTQSSERRDGPRIDLRLRVRYSADSGATGEAEASDVSPRGCRLEAEAPVVAGSELQLIIDGGDDEELKATGKVTWCRQRLSPGGHHTFFDIGVAFTDEWLAQDRGPLGTALARIFAMNRYEPARSYERTKVSLRASTSSSPPVALEIVDLSVGGMQLRGTGDQAPVHAQSAVIVEIEVAGKTHSIDGKVVWIGGSSFGVMFNETAELDTKMLETMQKGDAAPERVTVFLQG